MFKSRTTVGREIASAARFGWKRDMLILVAVQMVLGTVYLSTVPPFYVDEAWYSALGHSLAYEGTLRQPIVEGFGGVDVHFVQNGVVLPLVSALIFKVGGYGIVSSRIGSLMFGVVAVMSLYGVMRRWFGARQAFWIVLATTVQPWFFEVCRRVRPEIYYIGLTLAFLWFILLFFDCGSRWAAFVSGVLAGLSGLTHANGLTLVFVISCAVILWTRGRATGRLILWASVGLVVVVVPYVIYVFWAVQDPKVSFIAQMQINLLHRSILSNEIHRWKNFFKWPKGAPLAIIMFVSWIVAWYRSSGGDKAVATIMGGFAFILPFTNVNYTSEYLAAITPFSSAVMVRLIVRVMAGEGSILHGRHRTRFVLGMGTAFVYLSICMGAIGLIFYHLRAADVRRVVDRVALVVGPESRVYGPPVLWLGHERYRYGPYPTTVKAGECFLLRDGINMVRKYNFDYAVRTSWLFLPKGIVKPPRSMPGFKDDRLCDHVCRIFGTKIDEFYDPYYGPVEIYKLNLDKSL